MTNSQPRIPNPEPPNPPPRVSVIIPTYNCGPYLAEAIDSALAQDYGDTQIVVADDGSTDETSDVLAKYDGKITTVQLNHAGAAAARNRAIEHATGSLLATLDADDIWLPGKIARQVAVMAEHPDAAVCHTGAEMFGTETGDGPMVHDVRKRIQGDCFDALFDRNGIITSTAMIRRSAIPACGFHDDLRIAQDYAWFLMILFGREAVYLPDVYLHYRRRPGQNTGDGSKRAQVYAGIGRLRTLDMYADRMSADQLERRRASAIDELGTCTYSRYWNGDYKTAMLGFAELRRRGWTIPWRHRVRARIGCWG